MAGGVGGGCGGDWVNKNETKLSWGWTEEYSINFTNLTITLLT